MDIHLYIANYSSAKHQGKMMFAWNGKHADAFQDANYEFRRQVLEIVLLDLKAAPIELIRDLYDAETAMALEAWGVYAEAVSALSEELLTRGGPAYVEDFLRGKIGRGMDAYCSAYFDCPCTLAERLLKETKSLLAEASDELRRNRLEAGCKIFEGWIQSAKR
jgi:hypothetical protein